MIEKFAIISGEVSSEFLDLNHTSKSYVSSVPYDSEVRSLPPAASSGDFGIGTLVRMRFNSLAFRLFTTAAAWTLLVLPIAGFIIYGLYRDDVQASFDGQLQKLVNAITVDSMGTGEGPPMAPANLYEPLFEVTHSGWYWQITPLDDQARPARLPLARDRDAALARRQAHCARRVRRALDESEGPQGRALASGRGDRHARARARQAALLHHRRRPAGLARSPRRQFPLPPDDGAWRSPASASSPSRCSRCGSGCCRCARSRAASPPSAPAPRRTLEGELPAEIEPLQSELNALIRSNQDIVDRARTQVGNLAHALKTPLAVITNEARGDKTGLGAKVAEQAQIMSESVKHYLDRARMAARVNVIGRVTPVAPVVEPLVRTLERIHQEKGVKIAVACPPDARFQGERQDLEEMLGNLLDNACKWARRAVRLTVEVTPTTGRTARAAPNDHRCRRRAGAHARAARAHRQAGLRLDETKPGSGLGLSIVMDLAQSYRGNLRAGARARTAASRCTSICPRRDAVAACRAMADLPQWRPHSAMRRAHWLANRLQCGFGSSPHENAGQKGPRAGAASRVSGRHLHAPTCAFPPSRSLQSC